MSLYNAGSCKVERQDSLTAASADQDEGQSRKTIVSSRIKLAVAGAMIEKN